MTIAEITLREVEDQHGNLITNLRMLTDAYGKEHILVLDDQGMRPLNEGEDFIPKYLDGND